MSGMRTGRATVKLHNLTANELERAAKAIQVYVHTLGQMTSSYPDSANEITADADALGLVRIAVLQEAERRRQEDRDRAYMEGLE